MPTTLRAAAVARQSATDDLAPSRADQPESDRSARADLVRWLGLLMQAMTETGWTVEALDAHWGTSRGYAWRLVNGEKPWSVERMLSLPVDLQARFEALRAESYGHVVVRPLGGVDAVRALVAGLVGVIAAQVSSVPALPDRTSGMAKASVADAAALKRRA